MLGGVGAGAGNRPGYPISPVFELLPIYGYLLVSSAGPV